MLSRVWLAEGRGRNRVICVWVPELGWVWRRPPTGVIFRPLFHPSGTGVDL